MAEGENKWIVMVLKDRHANDLDRSALKESLMGAFGLGNSDVYFVSESEGTALNNFIFVKERDPVNDLRNYLEFRRDMFEPYTSHMRITDKELGDMIDGIGESKRKPPVKHGDIVLIKTGIYSKLYGIVLRENRSKKVDVGLKFCFGTVTEQFSPNDFDVIGNIFKHLKILK